MPNTFVDVKDLDVDFLAWSFHKMIAPFGVGALYAKEELLKNMRPFLYGGDMIAEGQVSPEEVKYNSLPWKFTAGTPNILADGSVDIADEILEKLDYVIAGVHSSLKMEKKELTKEKLKQ